MNVFISGTNMVSKFDIETAKNIDLMDMVMNSGARYRRGTGHIMISCPFHGPEKVPSCAIYPDHFFCYGCQQHGDIIDFVRLVEEVDFETAVKKILAELNE